MFEQNKLTLEEIAIKMNEQMYKKNKNILNAYSHILNKYGIDYSYEEVKDYLFHHNPMKEQF